MKIEELKSKNGIRIIIVPNENATSTTVSISAGIGSDMEEKEISGLSHLAEHMMFKGTTKRPNPLEIIQEFDNLGSFYNAYTSREYTTYFAKSRPESLSKIFDLLADMYKNSSFNEKELTKEKGVVIEEIRMYNDQPDALANLLLRQIAYGDTPEGRSIAGSIETVSSATAEVLKEFRNKYYCAENTVVVVSGKLNKNEVMDLVEEKLGDLRSGGKIIHTREVFLDRAQNVKHHKKETEQTHVVIAFPSFKIGTEKDVKMTVLKYILGGGLSSRLSILLREELGASYYAYADNDSLRNYGLFEIAAGIKTEILNEAMEGIAKCLKNLKEELVTEIEMSRTIESLSGKIAIAMETTDSVANYVGARAMAEVELLTPQERIAEIRKVTKEDILKLANEIFIKENVFIHAAIYIGKSLYIYHLGKCGVRVGSLENILEIYPSDKIEKLILKKQIISQNYEGKSQYYDSSQLLKFYSYYLQKGVIVPKKIDFYPEIDNTISKIDLRIYTERFFYFLGYRVQFSNIKIETIDKKKFVIALHLFPALRLRKKIETKINLWLIDNKANKTLLDFSENISKRLLKLINNGKPHSAFSNFEFVNYLKNKYTIKEPSNTKYFHSSGIEKFSICSIKKLKSGNSVALFKKIYGPPIHKAIYLGHEFFIWHMGYKGICISSFEGMFNYYPNAIEMAKIIVLSKN